jgi:hypothetical protein
MACLQLDIYDVEMKQTSNVTIAEEAFSSYAHIIFEYTDGSVDSIITITS